MRSSWSVLLLGVAVAAAAAFTVALQRAPWAPTPAECLGGDGAALGRWSLLPWAGLAAAVVVAGIARWSPRGAAAGPFGGFAAIALAGGLPFLLAPLPMPPWTVAVGAALAVGVAAAALPLLAERAPWSLALGALLAAPAYVWAWRQARIAAQAAAPLAEVVAAVEDRPAVALLVDDSVDDASVRALCARLRPPFRTMATDVLAAAADSMAALWLPRMALPVFEWNARRCQPSLKIAQPLLPRGNMPVSVAFARGTGGSVQALSIRCEGARSGQVAVVFTPAGAVVASFGDEGLAVFGEAERAMLRRLLAPLPSGAAIRVLVALPDTADVLGWTELRT